MLAVTKYAQDYIDDCRAQMEAQLAAYKKLVSATAKGKASAVESFEPLFFNNLTLVLDHYFVHRTRAIEGKDGNPLNEVRMLSNSILLNHAVMGADKTIKYKPETSVSKISIGDEIRLDESQFRPIFKAFFAEIQDKFT
jgi:hypothetical protein